MKLSDILFMRKVAPLVRSDGWFKRNQMIKFAFLYKGRPAHCYKLGIDRVFKSLQYVKAARDARKIEVNQIWNERLSIASEQSGLPYTRILLEGLSQSNIALNRNMLQLLAVYEPKTFSVNIYPPDSILESRKKHSKYAKEASPNSISCEEIPRMNFTASDYARATLNQLKFGWNLQFWPSFSQSHAIRFLGRNYLPNDDNEACPDSSTHVDGDITAFGNDFTSQLWFTYREGFVPLCSIHANSNEASGNSKQSKSNSNNLGSDDLFGDNEMGVLINHTALIPSQHSIEQTHSGPSIKRLLPSLPRVLQKSHHHSGMSPSSSGDVIQPFRKETVPLSVQTSDSGWGCMLRSGQMLLARALLVHFLGRSWRMYRNSSPADTQDTRMHRDIIRWFQDAPSPNHPFSIHAIVTVSDQLPGSWFGPATMCSALVKLMRQATTTTTCGTSVLSQVQVYLARDRVIYRKDIMDLARGNNPIERVGAVNYTDHTSDYASATSKTDGALLTDPMINGQSTSATQSPASSSQTTTTTTTRAVLILIPLMLGLDRYIDRTYAALICHLFTDPCCVGLIGGRPKHSIYVSGSCGKRLVYMDPHFVQSVVDVSKSDFPLQSWHCQTPRLMDATKLDPSCAVGFYCRSPSDARDLLDRIPRLFAIPNQAGRSLVEVLDAD